MSKSLLAVLPLTDDSHYAAVATGFQVAPRRRVRAEERRERSGSRAATSVRAHRRGRGPVPGGTVRER